jgi:predicted esterase
MGQENHIKVQRTARYFTWGHANPNTKYVWFVLHGYGQLAPYFIKKFEKLDPDTHFIVAPEALSRFYYNNMGGRVGATWMTSEDRLNEIEDYTFFLQSVYDKVLDENPALSTCQNTTLLGFSQGATTVTRWLMNGKVKFNRLIAWAGMLPHDMDFEKFKEILSNKECQVVYGLQDELFVKESFEGYLNDLKLKGFEPQVITFEGKHELNEEIILNLGHQMNINE